MTNAALIANDPGWLILAKAGIIFAFALVTVLLFIWAERRILGFMQNRLGPNRVGPFGLLQSLADGIKCALKDDIIPSGADKIVFVLAPAISAGAAFMSFAVMPATGEVTLFGQKTVMQLTDLPVGVLYVLAIASVGVYGIVLAGWSSGSTYPLLGGLRSSAQVISYEVAMGLSLVSVFIYSGSMSTGEIVAAQNGKWWYAVVLFPSFIIYVISMFGETNRAPFDLAEAEGELVAGFHTEYSSLKFALFFLAEYINIVAISALCTTLFLGGYHAFPGLGFTESWLGGWFTAFWFLAKVYGLCYFFIWVRGTLPRIRYDQFMKFGWKVLIPFNLVWIMVVATLRVLSQNSSRTAMIIFAGVIVALAMLASFLYDKSKTKAAIAEEDFVAPAPNFPVPALPTQPTSKVVNRG